jgi:hypothetical protein
LLEVDDAHGHDETSPADRREPGAQERWEGTMSPPGDLLGRAEDFANSEDVGRFAVAYLQDPELGARFEEQLAETLAEFGVKLPKGLDIVPLGGGYLGKPGPDFEPFGIRFSRCKTVVVRDPKTGRLRTEAVCFGIEIVPRRVPGGPIG